MTTAVCHSYVKTAKNVYATSHCFQWQWHLSVISSVGKCTSIQLVIWTSANEQFLRAKKYTSNPNNQSLLQQWMWCNWPLKVITSLCWASYLGSQHEITYNCSSGAYSYRSTSAAHAQAAASGRCRSTGQTDTQLCHEPCNAFNVGSTNNVLLNQNHC